MRSAQEIDPDVIVLDIMLPDVDGLQILQRVRESESYTPTLFLTARDSVMDRVTGRLSLDGADISPLRTYQRAKAGIAYVPQGRMIFPLLTVRENLANTVMVLGDVRKPGRVPLTLAGDLALTDASVRKFADNEIFVEIHENVRGEDMFVIQSTSYPVNDNLMELLICIDALRGESATWSAVAATYDNGAGNVTTAVAVKWFPGSVRNP